MSVDAATGSGSTARLQVRLAASLIVSRGGAGDRELLMGRRPKTAVFMPGKLVFPGGAVDAEDKQRAVSWSLTPGDDAILSAHVAPDTVRAVGCAAERELGEETGYGLPNQAQPMLIARAITPPGRTRRFDAWFFLVDLGGQQLISRNEPDGELEDVSWRSVNDVRDEPLAMITRFVLAQAEARWAAPECVAAPAFVREHDGEMKVTPLTVDALC